MTTAQDLLGRSASELGRLLRRGELRAVDLLDATQTRIDALDTRLGSFITLTPELAREQAKAADAALATGRDPGPWCGLPVGLKDLLYTNGVLTTAGSSVLAGFVPDYDATVVAKLRSAGAVFPGKQNMHEFALGITNENLTYGPSRNPWSLDHIPGGSSGGSAAAVAAGLCVAAIGSDTGGSIRIPASCCGVVGLMPTYGRVSRHGVVPLSWSLDHVGPIARSVGDAASLLEAIAGYDPRDGASDPRPLPRLLDDEATGTLKGVRIAVPRNYFFDRIESEVARAVQAAAAVLVQLGATLVDVDVAHIEHAMAIQYLVAIPEALSWHRRLLSVSADRYAPRIRQSIESGEHVSAADYLDAQRVRVLIRRGLIDAVAEADAMLTPTIPVPPPKIGEDTLRTSWGEEDVAACLLRLTSPIDLSGQPALSAPCGFSTSGLPLGFSLIGRPFDERTICRIARAYERAAPDSFKSPAVSVGMA